MLNVMSKPVQALLIMLCVATVLLAAAQERTAPPALPPEAQQAFDRGLTAVKQREWGLAARYFSDAQWIAPYAPTVLFNLGLAHDKAGHELPAIAWLQTYLAVTPQAPNAEAIRAEIERLKTVTRGKMNTIFQTAIAAAQQLDPDAGTGNTPGSIYDRSDAFYSILNGQAAVGDMEGAIATAELTSSQEAIPKLPSMCWSLFAQELIKEGDLEGAQEALENVTEAKDQDEVWAGYEAGGLGYGYSIFSAMLESGDIEAARNAVQKIHDADKRGKLLQQVRVKVLKKIVDENARKGDFDFVPVEELLPLLEYNFGRINQLLGIAEQQGKFKDAEGRSQTINRALKLARQEQKSAERASRLHFIAYNLFEQGDFSSAKSIAREVLACGKPASDSGELDAAGAHAILGNVSEALALSRNTKYKDSALGYLVYFQVMSGDLEGAKKTEAIAASILDDKESGHVRIMLARAQLKKGDPAGALETLKRIRVASYYFSEDYGKIFDYLMTEGQVSKAMEVAKLVGEVAQGDHNPGSLLKEYLREMGLIQIQSAVGDKAGKPEAAQVTTHFAHVANWIALAIEVSTDKCTGDLKKALKDAAEAKDLADGDRIKRLAEVARSQGIALNKISVLERKSGQERGVK